MGAAIAIEDRVPRARLIVAAAVAIVAGSAFAGCSGDLDSSPAAMAGHHRHVAPNGRDRDDGSRARPWRTLTHAARVVEPGTTVHVAPGRYAGPLRLARGGVRGRPVRFVSDDTWRATVTAVSDGPLTIVELRGSYIVFEGFAVSGRGGDGTQGIDVEGNHDAVVANHVYDLELPCRTGGYGGAGILAGGGKNRYRNHDTLVARNLVERIGSSSPDAACRLVHGIYAAVPRVRIVNNIVVGAAGDGISSWHAARELVIVNNLSTENGGDGIGVGSGDDGATRGNAKTLVANNIAYRNDSGGITESSDGNHRVGPGNRYLHNLVFANQADSLGVMPGAMVSGTIDAAPLFTREATGDGQQYFPASSSPVVDAGTVAGAPRDDFAGLARPRHGGVDVGPYERR